MPSFADCADEAERLGLRVAGRFDFEELSVAELTPVTGAHSGPGVLSIVLYAD